jgi:hypothetical protein
MNYTKGRERNDKDVGNKDGVANVT